MPIAQKIRTILYDKLAPELNEAEVVIINSLPLPRTLYLLQREFYEARDNDIAWRAFYAIKSIKSYDKVQFVIACLRYSSHEWRTIYCQTLAELGGQNALHTLYEIYKKDHDVSLRYKVANLLATVGDESVVNDIKIEQSTHDHFADFPIASITKRLIQQIHERLASGPTITNERRRHNSASIQDIQVLFERWMNETEQLVALQLFEAILQVEEFDKIQWLANLLDKSTVGWRAAYIEELSNYAEQQVVDFLVNFLLHDPDSDIRYVTARALGRNGNESAITALTHAINHDTGTDYEGRPIATIAAQAIERIQERRISR